jgi:hypothetical protein
VSYPDTYAARTLGDREAQGPGMNVGLNLAGFYQPERFGGNTLKKIILAVAVAAVAITAVATSVASAGGPPARYQTQTATFTVLQPRNAVGQYDDVWTHNYKITINPCDNTFSGTGDVTANNAGPVVWTESITGSFGGNTVSFETIPNAGATFKVHNASYGVSVTADSTWTQNIVEMKASTPGITGTSDYKNHGDYVSSQGGGSDAAHSCIGMPVK